MERGAEVQVVMTDAAQKFITPMSFQAVSGRPARVDLWDGAAEAAMGHIELARWAELVLIAPASADFIARLAAGRADDLLATLCIATEAPIALAPAMNRVMWANTATQANVEILRARGVRILGPASGNQACGEIGEGRMWEPIQLGESGLCSGGRRRRGGRSCHDGERTGTARDARRHHAHQCRERPRYVRGRAPAHSRGGCVHRRGRRR